MWRAMPFNHYPQPNVGHWKPDYDTFDQDEERILVYLNWGRGLSARGRLTSVQPAV